MYKEKFNELFEEFVEENRREPEWFEIDNIFRNHCASLADSLRDEAKYE